jgi:hypothetical protein
MSNTIEDGGHGSSPAAWTAVVIMLIGFTIATAALFLDVIPLVWVGAVIVPIGLVVGGVMKAVGLGVGGHRATGSSH